MTTRMSPYLNFDGRTREAMDFYRSVFGGELSTTTFAEFGHDGPGADRIMHAQLETPAGFVLMAADSMPGTEPSPGNAITVSLFGDDEELRGWWQALTDGGQVLMPLEKQAWGDEFGMCTDRFGIPWMVNLSSR